MHLFSVIFPWVFNFCNAKEWVGGCTLKLLVLTVTNTVIPLPSDGFSKRMIFPPDHRIFYPWGFLNAFHVSHFYSITSVFHAFFLETLYTWHWFCPPILLFSGAILPSPPSTSAINKASSWHLSLLGYLEPPGKPADGFWRVVLRKIARFSR